MITFVLVVLALFLIPGPAVMLTLARSISGGRRIGIYTGIGIAVGDLIHTLALTLGLSAILMTSALAFEVVKYLGAAYLFYLGVRAFLEKSAGIHMPSVQRIDSHRAFRQAVLTEVLNPKTALFFLSFLPQFVQPEDGQVIIQLLVLGLTFVTLSIFYTTLLAFTAGSLGQWLSQHQGIARWQGKIMGFIYSGLGVQIALQHQD
ncbi:LysE family translocator [Aneurinibacillus danicus]|jgi:threonine/homoserine/homoserine lactone efflux protein|uniref:Lysine transporter LysE n=1 Tax=Aneurinibacillus danicus TaxID=267746 RepID=A0A511VBH4_9BACL|nr:LysE family translocator [Aneurinibacillus danicus]GEN36280.1 lysine transporter LysE [Aneurinibacillus danicus]